MSKFKCIDEDAPLDASVVLRINRRKKARLKLLPNFSKELRDLIDRLLLAKGL